MNKHILLQGNYKQLDILINLILNISNSNESYYSKSTL